ncbi:acyl carrier protein [Streptomyces sp. ODS28]|uniref:acyl carrier protein n=1 Tax=Streptomyces sp. ODS28 TaxID=3136688 RepID=UPI0031ED09ED
MSPQFEAIARHLIDDFDVPAELVRPETTFAELELDSLSLAELVVIAEEETGVRLGEVGAATTLQEAARQLEAGAPAAAAAGAEAGAGTEVYAEPGR